MSDTTEIDFFRFAKLRENKPRTTRIAIMKEVVQRIIFSVTQTPSSFTSLLEDCFGDSRVHLNQQIDVLVEKHLLDFPTYRLILTGHVEDILTFTSFVSDALNVEISMVGVDENVQTMVEGKFKKIRVWRASSFVDAYEKGYEKYMLKATSILEECSLLSHEASGCFFGLSPVEHLLRLCNFEGEPELIARYVQECLDNWKQNEHVSV